MVVNSSKVERLTKTIGMLEDIRDRALAAGEGPMMSDSIFDTIDQLYNELQNSLGDSSDENA